MTANATVTSSGNLMTLGSVKSVKTTLAAALFAVVSVVGFAAKAEDYVPPKIDTTTPTGVSLADGSFIYTNTDISIGPLTLERFHMGGYRDPANGFFGTHMSHNFDIYVAGNLTSGPYNTQHEGIINDRYKPIVHIGASATGVYVRYMSDLTHVYPAEDESLNGTLAVSGSAYVYTSQDGTVYTFNPSVAATGAPNSQRVASIVYPTGRTLTFSYVSGNLKLVSDSTGYAIVFDYNASNTVADACGFNLATTYVSTATTCSGATLKTVYSYTSGLLTGITDVLGDNTTLGYSGYEISCVQPPGYSACRITNTYGNASGPWQVTQQTLASGAVWHFVAPADSTMRTPEPGIDFEDPTGSTSVTDPAGNSEIFFFSKTSPYSVSDALGRSTNYVYTGGYQYEWTLYPTIPPLLAEGSTLVSVTYPEGNGYLPEHNAPYLAISKETFTAKPGSGLPNAVIQYGYGSCPTRQNCTKPIWKKDTLGNETDYTYDNSGNLLTEMAPAPSSGAARPLTVYVYVQKYAYIKNSAGTLVASSVPVWVMTTKTQCQTVAGGTTPVCDSTGPETVTTWQYGADGTANNLLPASITTKSADGTLAATTAYTYTDQGDVASADGPLTGVGDQIFTGYDAMRRKIYEIGAAYTASDGSTDRSATRTTYDLKGPVQKLEVGIVTGLSSPSMATFTDLNWILNGLDAYGRLITASKQHIESGSTVTTTVTQTSYDAFDRVICTAVRMNAAAFASPPSDACTLGTQGSFGADRITKNTYDAAGQLVRVTKAYGTPLQADYAAYSYSLNGKQLSVIDANGNRTNSTYDGLDRLVQLTFPSPTQPGLVNASDYEAYTYDIAGNRLTLRKRDASTIYFSYDLINRLKAEGTALADLPASCSATLATTVLACDAYDYLSHMISAKAGNGSSSVSTFDALGRKLTETNNSLLVSYQYDLAGNRTQITWPDSYYVTYGFDTANHMTSATANGSSALASFTYDSYGRIAWEQYGGSATHTIAYSWSPDDDLLTLASDLAGTTYDVSYTNTFTPAKQIATAVLSNSNYVFQQAAVNTPYVVNGLNQYTNVGGLSNTGATCGGTSQAFTYDCNGSLTSDGTFNFTYDPLNRLATAALRAGGMSATYAYDALGRRYQKAVTGGSYAGTTGYLDSGDDEIADYNGSTVLRRYVPGPSIDRPIAMVDLSGGTAVTTFMYFDRQGNVVAMADGSGNRTEGPYAFNAYGRCLVGGIACAGGVPFKYSGRRIDAETGLYYYRARYYSTAFGRFLQTDPVGYKDDLNWYTYVGNDPTNKVDPTGLDTVVQLQYYVIGSAPIQGDYGHSYVILTDTDTGEKDVARAGPSEPFRNEKSPVIFNVPEQSAHDQHTITLKASPITPASKSPDIRKDSKDVPGGTTIVKGPIAKAEATVQKLNDQLNAAGIAYTARGVNSNAYAHTVFENITGKPAPSPEVLPGSDINIDKLIPNCTADPRKCGGK